MAATRNFQKPFLYQTKCIHTVDGRNPAPMDNLSHDLQYLIDLRWCRISSINSMNPCLLLMIRPGTACLKPQQCLELHRLWGLWWFHFLLHNAMMTGWYNTKNVHLFICLFIYLSIYLFIYLFFIYYLLFIINLSIYSFIYLLFI